MYMLKIIKRKQYEFYLLLIEKNYSMYIDNFYLNMNRKSKKCLNCNKYYTNCDEKI